MLKTALLSCLLASFGSAYCVDFDGRGAKCDAKECALSAPSELVVKVNKSTSLPMVSIEYECNSDFGERGKSSSKSMRSLSFHTLEELDSICKNFGKDFADMKKKCGKDLKANLKVDSSFDEAQVRGILSKYFVCNDKGCKLPWKVGNDKSLSRSAPSVANNAKSEEGYSIFAKREPVKPMPEKHAPARDNTPQEEVVSPEFEPESFDGYFADMAKKMNRLFKGFGIDIEPRNEVMTLEEPPVNADKPAVKQRGFKKYPKKHKRSDFLKENGPFVGVRWYPSERFAFDLNTKVMKYTLEKVLSQYIGEKVICSMHNGNVTILVKETAGKSNSDYEKLVTNAINTIKANGGLVNDPNFSIASGEVRENLEARDFDIRKINLGEINARFNAIFAGGPSEIVAKLK